MGERTWTRVPEIRSPAESFVTSPLNSEVRTSKAAASDRDDGSPDAPNRPLLIEVLHSTSGLYSVCNEIPANWVQEFFSLARK